jgi:hypothetical protein
MRRRKDPFEKPWVIIAAAAGIIAVVVIALVFFTGSGSSVPSGSSGQPSATPSGGSSPQTIAVGVAPSAIKSQTPVTVPAEGVYVKVSYLGSFAGTYGTDGNMTSTRNSGDRIYVVENATGLVTATFHKEDPSTRHEITVGIWKDGRSLQEAGNSSAYGEASVTATF